MTIIYYKYFLLYGKFFWSRTSSTLLDFNKKFVMIEYRIPFAFDLNLWRISLGYFPKPTGNHNMGNDQLFFSSLFKGACVYVILKIELNIVGVGNDNDILQAFSYAIYFYIVKTMIKKTILYFVKFHQEINCLIWICEGNPTKKRMGGNPNIGNSFITFFLVIFLFYSV